jgi:hypothetical protein
MECTIPRLFIQVRVSTYVLKLPVLLKNFVSSGFICQAEQNRVSPSCTLADGVQHSFKPLVETRAKSHNSNKKMNSGMREVDVYYVFQVVH